jgi:hypothetical protein
MTLYEELVKAFKLKPTRNETFEEFAARASDKVNKCTDVQWNELTPALQVWVNTTLETREANLKLVAEGAEPGALPDLEGYPHPEEVVEDEDGEASEDEAEETSDGDQEVVAEDDQDSVESAEIGDGEETPPAAAKKKAAKKSRKATGKDKTMAIAAAAKAPKTAPAKKAVAKTAPPAKKATSKASAASARSPVGNTATIKVLAKENPHREGTKLFKYFSKYKDGMTVAAAEKAGIPPKNIAYLKSLGHIKVEKAKA